MLSSLRILKQEVVKKEKEEEEDEEEEEEEEEVVIAEGTPVTARASTPKARASTPKVGSSSSKAGSSSSKWKDSYDRNRKYNPMWERAHPWLTRESAASNVGFCLYCHRTVRPRIHSVMKHGQSESHIKQKSKVMWEKKQKIIMGAKKAPMVNPRRGVEEDRVQRIIMEIQENQLAMKRVRGKKVLKRLFCSI